MNRFNTTVLAMVCVVLSLFVIGCPKPQHRQAAANVGDERFELISYQNVQNSTRSFGVVVLKDKKNDKELIVLITYQGGTTLVKYE